MNFLDDLEIFFAEKMAKNLAEIYFTNIEEENQDLHEGWIILFNRRMKKMQEKMPDVLVHELEHYYVASLLFSWKIPTRKSKKLKSGNQDVILFLSQYPEWTHSDPSYGPERERERESICLTFQHTRECRKKEKILLPAGNANRGFPFCLSCFYSSIISFYRNDFEKKSIS